jgi:hypothetical protein
MNGSPAQQIKKLTLAAARTKVSRKSFLDFPTLATTIIETR